METKTVQLEINQRSASVYPETVNKEKRTFDVEWSKGARVLRHSWFSGKYFEELSMDEKSIRMDRLNSGAPFLNTHNQYELEGVIGVVERAWIENGVGKATIRMSERPDVDPIWKDIETGIVRNISVGYQVYKYEDITPPNEETRIFRAVDWEPCEISAVPVGADAGAGIRSNTVKSNPCEIINRTTNANERENMEPKVEKTEPVVQVDSEKIKSDAAAAATVAERTRSAEILKAVRNAKLGEEFAQELISSDLSLDKARAKIIDKLAESTDQTETRAALSVQVGDVEKHNERKLAAENSLLHRYNPEKNKLTENGKHFRGLSLLDIARVLVNARGINTSGMSKMELATRAFESTSDLPYVLQNVANKSMRNGYESAPQTFRPIVKENQAPDFKQMSRVQLSDAPALEKVNENGEIKRGAYSDGKEVYQLATYAKIVGITRQVLINDDMGAFTRIPESMGRAAADLESDLVWDIINANAAMGDGVALFHATHKNLGTAANIAVASLGEARQLMRKQLSLKSRPINVAPMFLIVPPERETEAEQFIGPIVPNAGGSVNPFSGKLKIIAEPRLSKASGAQPWFVAADPAQIDIIEISYLDGQRGAYMESQMGFHIDGMEAKVRLDFAAKALDFRGLVKNAGV